MKFEAPTKAQERHRRNVQVYLQQVFVHDCVDRILAKTPHGTKPSEPWEAELLDAIYGAGQW